MNIRNDASVFLNQGSFVFGRIVFVPEGTKPGKVISVSSGSALEYEFSSGALREIKPSAGVAEFSCTPSSVQMGCDDEVVIVLGTIGRGTKTVAVRVGSRVQYDQALIMVAKHRVKAARAPSPNACKRPLALIAA